MYAQRLTLLEKTIYCHRELWRAEVELSAILIWMTQPEWTRVPGQPRDSHGQCLLGWLGSPLGFIPVVTHWVLVSRWDSLTSWGIHLSPPLLSLSPLPWYPLVFGGFWRLFSLPLALLFLGGKGGWNSNCFKIGMRGSGHFWQKWNLCILTDLGYSAHPSSSLSPPPHRE